MRMPAGPQRMKVRDGEQPIIMIDGKRASEAQLGALAERDIASMAVYTGRDRMNFRSNGKDGLEVTSDPNPERLATEGALVAVTTKMAKAKAKAQKQP